MNKPYEHYFQDASLAERLLASAAVKIELPPSQHTLAIERYEAIRKYIERIGSPLHGKVTCFYPQGSMAIRATIKARYRNEGYDIDIVAELNFPSGTPPSVILDLLFEAINGEPGSQYYGKTERQTRCVTVHYADGMHLDVTPSVLVDEHDPRYSNIFHAKPGEPTSQHYSKIMNSWAFCEYFNETAPVDTVFAKAYRELAFRKDVYNVRADAEVHPVPAHSSEDGGKSAKVVALQLMKRNRNICYQSRRKLRMPPSVMLSALASELDLAGYSLCDALDTLSTHVLDRIQYAHNRGKLVKVRNPKCPEDDYTDRWPENLIAQRRYIDDLVTFRKQLKLLTSGKIDLKQAKDLLSAMFGENPAEEIIKDYSEELGSMIRRGQRTHTPTGRVIPAAAATVAAPSVARAHTFYGGWLDDENH